MVSTVVMVDTDVADAAVHSDALVVAVAVREVVAVDPDVMEVATTPLDTPVVIDEIASGPADNDSVLDSSSTTLPVCVTVCGLDVTP